VITQLQIKLRNFFNKKIKPASKIKLKQNRVFVLPTKICFVFGLTVFIILLAAVNYQNSMSYALGFWLFALCLVVIFQTHFNLEQLELTNVGFTPVFVGQECAFKVRLEANKRNYYALQLEFRENFFNWRSSPNNLPLIDVKKKNAIEVELLYPALRRGYLVPPKIKISSRFPLGLFVVWSWVNLDFKALVYPKPLKGELKLGLSEADQQNQTPAKTQSGADDFLGLKAYQSGDPKQRLDWKAYSRGMGLQVKQFGSDEQGTNPCIDFAQISGDIETKLSIMCWHVLELTKQNQAFSFKLPNCQISLNSGFKHQQNCLQALALYGT